MTASHQGTFFASAQGRTCVWWWHVEVARGAEEVW